MKIRPLSDRVIVKRLEAETKTASGIIIPDAATEKPDQGEIVAIGNGKVGDRVLFGKYSGQAFKIDGQELLTMREDDIIGVVEK